MTNIGSGTHVLHAFWTDTNNKQTLVWFFGLQFVPTILNQEDVVTAAGCRVHSLTEPHSE